MSATDFLCIQIGLTVIALWVFRDTLRGRTRPMVRLLIFIAAASYSFDYIANDLAIWRFHGAWNVSLLHNPVENTLFAMTMATHLLLIYLSVENRIAKKTRRSHMKDQP